jgi:hypothetical protein
LQDKRAAFAAFENLYVDYLQWVNFAMKFGRTASDFLP